MDVLCIGSAVLDITARTVDRKDEWKDKQRIDSIEFFIGGDAVNQCVRMADVGVSVGIVSAVGNDKNADVIRDELIRRNVNVNNLYVKDEYPTGTALVLLDKNAERTIFSVSGAYCELTGEDVKRILSPGLKAISIAGFFTEPVLEDDGGLLELLIETRKSGVLVFADLASDKRNLGLEGIKKFLPYTDYFLPSLIDAEKMTGLKGPEKNAALYRELGCGNVIIKCGADGCFINSGEYTGMIPAVKVIPVDTTGAGDCMAALFISRIITGESIKDACRYACTGASLSTLYKGAAGGCITPEKINSMMMQNDINKE